MTESLSQVLVVLRELDAIRYGNLVTAIAVVYDHAITLDAEVNLVWRGKRSPVRALFFLVRYYALGFMIATMYSILRVPATMTTEICTRNMHFNIIALYLSAIMTEALLQFRVYALYYKNKKVLAFIIVGYIATTVTSAWILGSGMSIGQSFPTEIPGGSTCTFPAFGKNLYQAWIPFSVYDTVLCALVVYRGYATYRSERLFGGKGRSLVNVMVRDSVVAFVFLTISYITSILLWNVLPPVYVQIPAVVIAGLSGIFSSRMILNIRDQATKQNSAFTSGNNWYLSETTFYG